MSKRKVDKLAGDGSLAAKLKARRQAVEAGDIAAAPEAYRTGTYTEDTLRRREDAGKYDKDTDKSDY